jgi:cell division transport system ATP-binding protein
MSRNASAAADFPVTDEVVRLDGVSMRYGDGPQVLSDLDFVLKPGSFHFITGPSGAGKTTLLRLISLAARPSQGRLEVFGQDVARLTPKTRPAIRRRIGVVFQELLLLDHLSVFDNAALPLRISGRRTSSYRNDVAELLSWVGLGGRMDSMPETLAGGEKQRLAIARTILRNPPILVLDEATSALDTQTERAVQQAIDALAQGRTTITIAHRLSTVRDADQIIVLDHGRIAERGTHDELLALGGHYAALISRDGALAPVA